MTAPSVDMLADAAEHADEMDGAALPGWLQLGVVVAIVVGTLLLSRWLMLDESVEAPGVERRAQSVSVVSPRRVPGEITVSGTGEIRARATVSLSPQVGGRVVSIAGGLASGGDFSAGEVLFALDRTDYALAVQQAEADRDSARAQLRLEQAESDTARREWALLNGGEAVPELVAREPQIAQARASLASAEARLKAARTDLARTRFSLPFDGRVIDTTIVVGQTLSAGQSYGSVYDVAALEAHVSLSPDELDRLRPIAGRDATLQTRVGETDTSLKATVRRVDSTLEDRTRLAGVVIGVGAPIEWLPGTFVSATIIGDAFGTALALPSTALTASNRVWVVADGALVSRQPRLLSQGENEIVVRAFDVADGVVTSIPTGAYEGMPVQVESTADGHHGTGSASGPNDPAGDASAASTNADVSPNAPGDESGIDPATASTAERARR